MIKVLDQLIKTSQKYEVRVDNHNGWKRTPPFYYDSLRLAYSSYFSTFHTFNASYEYYAQGINEYFKNFSKEYLDEENTINAILGFERYFELFLKSILRRINRNLIYEVHDRKNNIETLLRRIENKTFRYNRIGKKASVIPFRKTIDRFYQLADIVKNEKSLDSDICKRINRLLKKYNFLDNDETQCMLLHLNWYRDRILHKGNSLPSLWELDYLVTQKYSPIIKSIIQKEKNKLGESMYFMETVSGINILEKLINIKFDFEELNNEELRNGIFAKLLFIGHLKELGRANFNMYPAIRENQITGHEYNYKDPKARSVRFAEAERDNKLTKDVVTCPCCNVKSLVVYRDIVDNIFDMPNKKIIEWVKCYFCDYHIRYNVGDPSFFKLTEEKLFE